MKKFLKWIGASNRYLHLIGGFLIGLFANSVYCAAYAGIGVAGALELKDKLWGGKPDVIDFGITLVGVIIGYCIRLLTLKYII